MEIRGPVGDWHSLRSNPDYRAGLARATRMSVTGLRLLDGVLVLKVKRRRRVEQIRVLAGDSFDMERTALELRHSFDGISPTAMLRLWNLAAITKLWKRPSSNR